jgi:cytochrome P450
MAVTVPLPVTHNPVVRIAGDVWSELFAKGGFPPGPTNFDLRRTMRFTHDPLPILLDAYERFGPIFSVRLLHVHHVFMLGPDANHFVLVSNAQNFHWRDGEFGELIPLLGDGLLTIDADYHDRARRIMMPAFHSQRVAAAVDVMVDEAERALRGWRPGATLDVYHWMRELAMRIAMRALLGLDPDDGDTGARAAHHFERALGYLGTSVPMRIARGPGTPWRRMLGSRRVLDEIVFAEIARRRLAGPGDRDDVLSLLIEARDEADGSGLSDREIRDQLMTLLFAGHDTSTSTLSFLMYELARNPVARERVTTGGEEELEMALDETLRLYPPAWIGPRRAVGEFEFGGHHVPAGAYVNYCSWASHRLPDVWPEPLAFRPERFARERKVELPRGAYVPFGAGSRICIGKRFGQTEVKTVAGLILERFRLDRVAGHRMTVQQMPTLSPRGGLPMVVRAAE